MNILIPYSWLKDFVKTEITPEEIAEKLSLCGFSIERTTKVKGDHIFEVEVTSNRPDALSVLGIAREVGAILPQFGIESEFSDNAQDLKIKPRSNSLRLNVKIENPELCPRFTALILDNIKVKPSPKKIQERLEKVKIRALNNVIDITNYMMVERGQPMHIFDYDKIAGATMILRESRKGERIVTLDGQERDLPQGTIVIEDGENLIDLCGIMGGENSGVDKNTKRVVLFVQIYDPVRIRRTTQEMAFRTEASSRFEKGMDPLGVIPALKQAARFLTTEAEGKIASDLIDIVNKEYEPHEVTVTIEQIENLLGIDIEPEKISRILKPLGFEARWTTAPNEFTTAPELKAKAPSWRTLDIKIPEDVIEEVARIHGYYNLPTNLPPLPKKLPAEEKIFSWERKVRALFKGLGFSEVYAYSFTSAEILKKAGFNPQEALRLKNPLTEDLTYLRLSLLPQLLEVAAKNQARSENQKLFQLSRIFVPQKGKTLPQEPQRLSGLTYSAPGAGESLFYKAKGIVEILLSELGIKKISYQTVINSQQLAVSSLWHPTRYTKIRSKSAEIGILGEIQPQILSNFEIKGQVIAFDLDFGVLAELAITEKSYQPIPEHPPIVEDLTFEVGENVLAGKIAKKVLSMKYKVLSGINIEIKDVYRDERLEKQGKKAITFNIAYQARDRGLSDEEVKPIREKIIKEVEKEFGAKLRGKI